MVKQKKCPTCMLLKDETCFYLSKSSKDGLQSKCKECKKQYANTVISKEKAKIWREENKDSLKISGKIWREENADKKKQCAKKYRENNKEYIAKRDKRYAIKNKEKISVYQKEYKYKNKEKIALDRKNYVSKRLKEDAFFKFKHTIRSRIKCALLTNRYRKNQFTIELLGTSFEIARKHIERQFTKGMTWENHGLGKDKWHIDHRVPLASAKNEEELKPLFHYTNLQPLWHDENIIKRDKIVETQLYITI